MSIPKVKRYENGKEIVGQVDTPYEITWEAWQLLTDAEKEKRKWLITDVPSADGFITVENMKLLWSNPSPTASFASQTITLNSADYDFYLCVFAEAVNAISIVKSAIATKGKGIELDVADSTYTFVRLGTYVSDTSISFGQGYKNQTADNSACIPIAIYGFKQQTEIRFNALAQNVKATVDYSTDEHPIGTWIDGSTLYEKTVSCGALPSSAGSKTTPHNISNINKILDIRGVTMRTTGVTLPLPMTDISNVASQIALYADKTNIYVFVGGNQSMNVETYATIRYTKTS